MLGKCTTPPSDTSILYQYHSNKPQIQQGQDQPRAVRLPEKDDPSRTQSPTPNLQYHGWKSVSDSYEHKMLLAVSNCFMDFLVNKNKLFWGWWEEKKKQTYFIKI